MSQVMAGPGGVGESLDQHGQRFTEHGRPPLSCGRHPIMHSTVRGDWMPREKAGEALRKMLRLLQWKQMVRPRHDQAFDSRQPFEQPLVALVVRRMTVAADQQQHPSKRARYQAALLPDGGGQCSVAVLISATWGCVAWLRSRPNSALPANAPASRASRVRAQFVRPRRSARRTCDWRRAALPRGRRLLAGPA